MRRTVLLSCLLLGLSGCISDVTDELGTDEQFILPAPATLTAMATSSTRIQLQWSAVAGAAGYYINMSTMGGPFTYRTTAPGSATSIIIANLSPVTDYGFTVATKDFDNSASATPAGPANATTLADPATIAGPTNLAAMPTATNPSTRIVLTWDAMPGAVGYYVFMAQGAGTLMYRTTVPTNITIIANLMPGTMYSFAVATKLADGSSSAQSATVSTSTSSGGAGNLVINEVEYDEPGTDTAEFVEIYNPTSSSVSLANYTLRLVNGANNLEYGSISLASAVGISPGGYVVVAPTGFVVPPGVSLVPFVNATNNLQNGAPDGVALFDGCILVDALSYEGSITMANVTGCGTYTLVEGSAATVADDGTFTNSMSRVPNGTDTNNAASDWAAQTPTPGAAN